MVTLVSTATRPFSGQSIVTRTRLGNPDPVRIITRLQNIYPVTGITRLSFPDFDGEINGKTRFWSKKNIFQVILAENLIFSQKIGFFRRLRPFLALGPIISQKLIFSGACGYVSNSEPLLFMPGYPEVPGYKRRARLP